MNLEMYPPEKGHGIRVQLAKITGGKYRFALTTHIDNKRPKLIE